MELSEALRDGRKMEKLICKLYCANSENNAGACEKCSLQTPIRFTMGEGNAELIEEGFLPSGRDLVDRYISDFTDILESLFNLEPSVGGGSAANGVRPGHSSRQRKEAEGK